MVFPSLSVFFFVFHLFLLTLCDANNFCKSFPCKDIGTLEYPFTDLDRPECGLIEVDCNSSLTTRKIKFGNQWTRYEVMKMYLSSDELMVRDTVLQFQLHTRSCDSYVDIYLPDSPSISFKITQNLTTLFKCYETSTHSKSVDDYFENYKKYSGCDDFTVYYQNPWDGNLTRETGHPLPSGCWSIQLPIKATENSSDDLFKLLTYEYTIKWQVSNDPTKGQFVVYYLQNETILVEHTD